MEFAAAALTAIGSAITGTGAAAAGTAATAATAATATSTLFSASTFASILSGTAGLVGAMGAVRAGQAQATAYEQQAADAKIDAKSEEINNINKQASLKRALLQTFGERDVAYGASGVDLSFGTPQAARELAQDDASKALAAEEDNSVMRAARLRERSSNLLLMADESRRSGNLRAMGSVLSGVTGAIRRG